MILHKCFTPPECRLIKLYTRGCINNKWNSSWIYVDYSVPLAQQIELGEMTPEVAETKREMGWKRLPPEFRRHAACLHWLKYYSHNPEKCKARATINNAIAAGKLKRQPCSICNNLKAQAHHPDYSKPLEIIWLCRQHHKQLHRESAGQQTDRD